MVGATSAVRRLGRAALDLVFPPRCVGCGESGNFLCDGCVAALPVAAGSRCPRCWQPGSDASLCVDCQAAPPSFDGLRAAFVYERTARDLVHALKYRGMTALAPPMGSLLTEAARRHDLEADLVAPVPLSGLRRRLRGYNQAEALARPLAMELQLPLRPQALARRRDTPPQARSADAEARRRNVTDAFVCRDRGVEGQRILLVDDVTTTGATLAACAVALKAAGAESVWAITFARED